jgi:hypothetical protein
MAKITALQVLGLVVAAGAILGLLYYLNTGANPIKPLQSLLGLGEGFEDAKEDEKEKEGDDKKFADEEGFEDGEGKEFAEHDDKEAKKEFYANGGTGGGETASEEGFVGGYDTNGKDYYPVGGAGGRAGVPSNDNANCYTRDGLNPQDLLPQPSVQAAQFLASNPPTSGKPENRNLLDAGFHIGVDTVCQSNKNPNLQLRSDPPIPRTGPMPVFNASTIPAIQNNRRILEVGGELNPAGCGTYRQQMAAL